MGRSKRGRKVKKTASDEEDINENEGPDPESDDFFHDAVDKFNLNREKILLDADADESDAEDSIEDEEVIGLDLPDEDEDDDENDDDDDDDDSDQETKLPSDKSWGKKKSAYYSADTNEQQVGHAGSDDEAWEMEKEEEVEALALQKRLTAGLDEEDFDTADFEIPHVDDTEETSVEDEEVNKTIVMDLTKLSKEQKLEMLFRNSPELFELLDEFKEKLEELSSKLSPLMQLSKTGKLPIEGSKYVELKYRLVLNYCINIGFYLLLKSKQTPVKDHPVIERIVQYRNIIKELEPLDKKLENDIQFLVENKQALLAASENTEFDSTTKARKTTKSKKVDNKKQVKKPKAKLSSLLDDSDEDTTEMEPKPKRMKKSKDSIDPLEYYEKVRLEKKKAKEMKNLAARLAHEPDLNLDDFDVNEEGKRAITYQISKNKGLTARKKKEDRNPRVKHRKKYSKAIIKRKSQVRPVTNEITRYDGEKSGIRAFLTRSTKIK